MKEIISLHEFDDLFHLLPDQFHILILLFLVDLHYNLSIIYRYIDHRRIIEVPPSLKIGQDIVLNVMFVATDDI